jgi:hypothetical protein
MYRAMSNWMSNVSDVTRNLSTESGQTMCWTHFCLLSVVLERTKRSSNYLNVCMIFIRSFGAFLVVGRVDSSVTIPNPLDLLYKNTRKEFFKLT